jgi:hypothetical protein
MINISEDKEQLLTEYAEEIRFLKNHTLDNLIEIGRFLTEAKAILGHGYWLPWLEREINWDDETARRYMRVYELNKSRDLRNLDIPFSGLQLLAAPSTPDEAKTEVFDRAASGEKLTHTDVQQAIAKHKAPAPKAPSEALIPVKPKLVPVQAVLFPKPPPKEEPPVISPQEERLIYAEAQLATLAITPEVTALVIEHLGTRNIRAVPHLQSPTLNTLIDELVELAARSATLTATGGN